MNIDMYLTKKQKNIRQDQAKALNYSKELILYVIKFYQCE